MMSVEMPTYSYTCTECGTAFDIVQSFSDDSLTECPTCGGRLRKNYGNVGVVFKGGGFYRNDSRAGANGSSNGSGSGSTGSGSSGSTDSASSTSSTGSSSGGASDGASSSSAASTSTGSSSSGSSTGSSSSTASSTAS